MKNILSSLTSVEKNRILEMHKKATLRNYIKEESTVATGILNVGNEYNCEDKPELKRTYDQIKSSYEVMDQSKKNSIGMGSKRMRVFRYKDKVKGTPNEDQYFGVWTFAIDCMQKLYGDVVTLGQDPRENTETGEAVAGGMKIDTGTKFQNGLTILDSSKIKVRKGSTVSDTIVWLPTNEDGGGNEFVCGRHERGTYILWPTGNGKYTLTKEESQALYNKFCKK